MLLRIVRFLRRPVWIIMIKLTLDLATHVPFSTFVLKLTLVGLTFRDKGQVSPCASRSEQPVFRTITKYSITQRLVRMRNT